jgi:hypothetical protein
MTQSQPAVAPPDAAAARPQLCQALIAPWDKLPDGDNPEPLEELYLWAEKCMEPATMTVSFQCVEDDRHNGRHLACDGHAEDDDHQLCGYCVELGRQVPAIMTVTSIL